MGLETELHVKRQRVAALMDSHGLAGLLLGRNSSVSWALAGAEAHVATNGEEAIAAVLYTPQRDYVLTNRIERARLVAEELAGRPFEVVEFPWEEPQRRAQLIAELSGGGTVLGDVHETGVTLLCDPINALRYQLTPEEQTRMRDLSGRAGAAIETAIGEIAPGMSEYAMAGLLAEECFLRDINPVVLLIATDERIHQFRHPIPTAKKLERYAMLVLCARRYGLVTSVTRLVHFGPIPAELQRRAAACAAIDAAIIAATRPGTAASALFVRLQHAYAAQGFPDEWRDHHQGGAAGYENREWVCTPTTEARVFEGQAFSWNPSIAGVKSEDTVLVTAQGAQVLTATDSWPKIAVDVAGQTLERPAILEVD